MIVPIAVPEHTDCVAGLAVTVGFGFTVTVTVNGSETHKSCEVAKMLNVVVIGALVEFDKVPLIEAPVPRPAIPGVVATLSLVQL